MTQPVHAGVSSPAGAMQPDGAAGAVSPDAAQAFRSALAAAVGRPGSGAPSVAGKDSRTGALPPPSPSRGREPGLVGERGLSSATEAAPAPISVAPGGVVAVHGSTEIGPPVAGEGSQINYTLQADGAWLTAVEDADFDYRADASGFVDVPLAAALSVPAAVATKLSRTGSDFADRSAAAEAAARAVPITTEGAEVGTDGSEPRTAGLLSHHARSAVELKVAGEPGHLVEYVNPPTGKTGAGLDPTRSISDPGALHPELRQRLDRVIERMASEFGHRVEVVETVRTRERQDRLFASGRSEPGPVVTWTRDSRHLVGEAADVRIDGGWSDARAFLRLNRIADQEGLRTLWPRDPGHIELATASDRDGAAPSGAPERKAGSSELESSRLEHRERRGGGSTDPLPVRIQPHPFPGDSVQLIGAQARAAVAPGASPVPATVARVAAVAQVAPVAAVAQVAEPAMVTGETGVRRTGKRGESAGRREEGSWSTSLGSSAVEAGPASPTDLRAARTSRTVDGLSIASADSFSPAARDRARDVQSAGLSSEMIAATADSMLQDTDGDLMRVLTGDSGSLAPAAPGRQGTIEALRSDSAERIARVLRLQEAAPERPLSSVLLQLDSPDGGQDRIRVDLRGASAVETTLDVRDAQTVENLKLHAPELQRALERHGFDGEGITVRTLNRAAESAAGAQAQERDATKLAQAGSSQSPSAGAGGRDGGRGPATRQDDFRRDADERFPRERRHDKGGR